MQKSASRLATSLILALVGTGILRAHGQAAVDLDLSSVARPLVEEPADAVPRVGRVPGIGPVRSILEKPAVAIRLLAVEPSTCTWHSPITYDVEVTNISRGSIDLPWSVDSKDADVTEPVELRKGYSKANFSLAQPVAVGGAEIGGIESLYGSQYRAFSHRRLAPAKSVRIRGNSYCHVYNDSLVRVLKREGSVSTPAVVIIQFFETPDLLGDRAVSKDDIRLTITLP